MSFPGQNPIIVSGAGPVGCAFALHMARNNIPVLVLEREVDLPEDLRASTWHPPTLDLLDPLDVTERLINMGLVVPNYQYRDRQTHDYADFDLGLLKDETNHPYRLQIEQFRFTRIVCEILKSVPGAEVKFDHGVSMFQQDEDGVDVVVDTSNGQKIMRASYLVAGDGAASAVRIGAGIEYEGFTYPEKFLVASTPYSLENHFPGLAWVNYIADPKEWCVLLRCNNLWRVLLPTVPKDTDEKLLSDEHIQERLHYLADIEGDYEIGHRTLYKVHQRVASTYRVGRVLLAGDAAHINNPLGGMGMNGGVQDAINLAQKMIMMAAGEANETILDLYDRQRRIICRRFVQEQTIKNKEALENPDLDAQKKHLEHMKKIASDPIAAKTFLMRTSMIDSVRESLKIN